MSSGFRLRILAGNSATKLIGISVSVLQGDASFQKMAIWILTQKSMKLLGWEPFEKLSAMSWLTITSIIRAKVTAMGIKILKNCSRKLMVCATLHPCPTRNLFSSMNAWAAEHLSVADVESIFKNTVADAVWACSVCQRKLDRLAREFLEELSFLKEWIF